MFAIGSTMRALTSILTLTASPLPPRIWGRRPPDSRRDVRAGGQPVFDPKGRYLYFRSARDFNLTFPKQYMADFSWVFGKPQWWDVPETRFGVRSTWRSLDRYSPRFCPTQTTNGAGDSVCDPLAPGFADGNEWEIRTYLTVAW